MLIQRTTYLFSFTALLVTLAACTADSGDPESSPSVLVDPDEGNVNLQQPRIRDFYSSCVENCIWDYYDCTQTSEPERSCRLTLDACGRYCDRLFPSHF